MMMSVEMIIRTALSLAVLACLASMSEAAENDRVDVIDEEDFKNVLSFFICNARESLVTCFVKWIYA